jgi:hypothetical protein
MLARTVLLLSLFLSACTAEQAYNSAQGWQQNRCNGIPDKTEYDRCMAGATAPYDAYKRQTESGKKR